MENRFYSEKIVGGTTYRFTNMRPGGNDTALIQGIISDPLKRKAINDDMMGLFPSIEQVGFVDFDNGNPQVVMAGGEFCGNATRSAAYLALNGKPGEIYVQVSGVKNKLRAGVDENGEAFAQMPIYPDPQRVASDPEETKNSIVYMEGIAQYINWDTSSIEGKSSDEIKAQAMSLIKAKGLAAESAAGVMYVREIPQGLEIVPVVYVRDINTLFLETACGSGTTALGITLAKQKGSSIKDMAVYQPSGLAIKVSVEYDGNRFGYAQIQGPIDFLEQGVLLESQKGAYAITKVASKESLKEILDEKGLIELYQSTFTKAPYYENFTQEDVRGFFQDYVQNGMLFLARNDKGIIGFGAAIPLSMDKELGTLASSFGIDPQSTQYMADLGVGETYQRMGIGEQLVRARLDEMPQGTTVLMRTSVENVQSQSLYRKLGFKTVEGMTQDVEQLRVDGSVKKDKRIFLMKVLK